MPRHTRNGRRRQYAKNKAKAKYMKAREEAQLLGIIPTEPSGAVRNEVVNPATQESQQFPQLERQAIRNGWSVPEDKKPKIVDNLYVAQELAVANGDLRAAAMNGQALMRADQMQHDRDNPKEAKGDKVQVNVNSQQIDWDAFAKAAEADPPDIVQIKIDELEALAKERAQKLQSEAQLTEQSKEVQDAEVGSRSEDESEI